MQPDIVKLPKVKLPKVKLPKVKLPKAKLPKAPLWSLWGLLLLLGSSCRTLPIVTDPSQADVTTPASDLGPTLDLTPLESRQEVTSPALPYWYAGKFHRFQRIDMADGLQGSRVWNVVQDSHGFMWFAGGGGLSRYDGREIKLFHHDPEDPGSMSSDRPRNLLVDRHGTLWITTWDRGLNRYDPTTESFTHYVYQEDGQGLSSNALTGVVEDDAGNLWISTLGEGLNRFNPETEQFSYYKHDPEDPTSLVSDTVSAIYFGSDQQLWVGTDVGIARLDVVEGTFRSYPIDYYVEGIYEDSRRNIWVSTQGGLFRFNPTTETFTAYSYPNGTDANEAEADGANIWTVSTVEDEAGFLWIGTWGYGLYRFDPETETFTQHSHQPSDPHSLSNNSVAYMYKDPS